ncbi:hypothetical protein CRUP_004987 [Coryphaenoides rupestris]|nr:hypothetical protein CRUP_004987 [Coryphaenoides rupestris]
MSEEKPAESALPLPPVVVEDVNPIPNGKGHEAIGDTTDTPAKTPPAEGTDKETVPNSTPTARPADTEAQHADSQEFLSAMDNKKTPRFTDFEGKTSFGMSVFNLGNAIMGSGILGLAYAMANTGVVLFLILLTVVAVLSSYSIHLLLKLSGIVGIRAYEQLGYRAFGTPGKMAAGIAITLQNIGAMSSYLYIVKYEFPLVIQAFLRLDKPAGEWYMNGNYLVIIMSIAIILPLTLMKQLGYLGYTSGFSLSCMVFFLVAVIYKKFNVPCPFVDFSFNATLSFMGNITDRGGSDDPACVPKLVTLNSQTAYTIPILAFAFVCHPEVLPIYTELRNPTKKKMQQVRRALQQMLFPNKTFYWPRHIAIAVLLLSLINLLAACFAGIGFLFMIMSLSFIIIDWTSGSSNASSGH